MAKPRILIFDIETTPLLCYTWGVYQQDVIKVVEDWYILCFAYKWYGERSTHVVALPDYDLYDDDPKDDYAVVAELHRLFDEADIIVAHNANKFDIKKTNARFLAHGLGPVSDYKVVDTLVHARRYFANTSNRLDSLGDILEVGRKLPHTGFKLWEDCMAGDPKAWRLMKRYNKQDVKLLEDVYRELLPWMKTHPNINLYQETTEACPKCGSDDMVRNGVRTYKTKTGTYQEWKCNSCGGYCTTRAADKRTKDEQVKFK